MSRFDDELRRAASPLAEQPLPDVVDHALDVPRARPRLPSLIAAAGSALLLVVVAIGLGQLRQDPTPLGTVPPVSPSASSSAAWSATAATSSPTSSPSPAAQATPPPAVPISASSERDGIRLTVSLDRDRTVAGQRVLAAVTIENIGAGSVYWGHSSTCVWPASVIARPDAPVHLAFGREDWPGDLAVLKRVTVDERLSTAPDPSIVFQPEEWLDAEVAMGCTSDLATSELPSGGTLAHHVAWDTVWYYGMPPAPGPYSVEAKFNFMSRGAPPTTQEIDEFSITVTLPLVVEGPEVDYVSPGEALDALLANDAYVRELEESPRELWVQSDIAFVDGLWETALYVTASRSQEEPVEAIVGTVDALSGEVVRVARERRAPPPGG